MKTALAVLATTLFCFAGRADLKELKNAAEFRALVQQTKVPVIVQFAAYWCGPCQELKDMLTDIAPDYADDKVIVAYVDAYVNSELKSYLQGGYPTVRTFRQGKLASEKFVGSAPESFVRNFIDSVITAPVPVSICALELPR